MRLLRETVDRTVQGEGGLVFLYGEAGIGKTRLTRELGAYARLRGVHVLYGRCPTLFRMNGVPPYVLWREVIRDYLDTSSLEQLYRVIGFYPAEVAKLVPEIVQKLRAIPQSFPISPEQEQHRLFEAVSQFITNISKEAPLLLVLDDLQWTDPSSLLLLHYLARGIQKTPLLLLGAYRNTEIDEKNPLTPVLAEFNRERLSQAVSLKRMSQDDTSEMIKQTLEQDDVPSEFCSMVYKKTRGNPFFTEEMIKSLKEEEAIYRENNRWKIKEVTWLEFPDTVTSLIKTRIGRLSDEHQNVLTMASLVGNDFTFEALRGVTGLEEDKLRKIVDDLLKTGLLKHRVVHGEDVCSFADIIVKDVVCEEVGTFERKRLHAEIGAALERVYARKIDEHLGEMALHFLEGGNNDKALGYFLKAGEKATKVFANSEAASYYQSALRLLEEREGDLQERRRVLEKLADIKNLVGENDESIKYLSAALMLPKPVDDKESEARLYRKMARSFFHMGDVEKAKECLRKASKILEAIPESFELVKVYDNWAAILWATENMAEVLSWTERAIGLAERLEDFEGIAKSYSILGTISAATGDLKKCIECLEKALRLALDKGYTAIALEAYNNLAISLPAQESERHLEYLEKGFELAKKAGSVRYQCALGENLAGMRMNMGNMNEAVSLAEESVTLARKSGIVFALASSLSTLSEVYRVLGDWDRAEQCGEEAFDISERLKDFQSLAFSNIFLGRLAFDKGQYIQAKESSEKAYKACEKAGAKFFINWSSEYVIWVDIELGELEEAKNLIDNLQKSALEVKDGELIADADVLRAMLFRAQKKWKESIVLFEKSLQEFEDLNAKRWNVYRCTRWVLCEFARSYLERDQEGDRGKARELLAQALEMFQRIGAKKDIEKVQARIAFIETGKVVTKPKPAEPLSTGYADLDKLLYGGIPANFAVLLTSPSYDERDLLVKDFLETGTKKGEVTFHVAVDPGFAKTLPEEFPSSFYLFVCNPQADVIVREAPNVFKLKGTENLTDLGIALTSAIRRLNPSLKGSRRICIGLVSDVLLQHHAFQTRRWLTALITELKSAGFTTLAVMDPRIHSLEELYAITGLFDGEISIFEKETERGLERYLRIKKMRDQKYLESELPLKKEQS
jgi:tetratricopeptide (TPR) repeat protein